MPFNTKPGARKYGDKPESMSSFKMRSGNKSGLPFKQMGSSPALQTKTYKELEKEGGNVNAAKAWNMKTYGTENPTADAKKLGISKDQLAKNNRMDQIIFDRILDNNTEMKPIGPTPTLPTGIEDAGPIEPGEIPETKTKEETKEEKKLDRFELGKKLQQLGASKQFQGKGAKSMYEMQQDEEQMKLTQDQLAKTEQRATAAELRAKKAHDVKYSDEQVAMDAEEQRQKIKRRQQLITATEKAENEGNMLDETELFAGTGKSYAEIITEGKGV